MIKSIKKNTKRVFCILASVVIFVASIFMFLPKEKNSAKAISNNGSLIELNNFPIKLNYLEYLSSSLYNCAYTVDNCLLNLSFNLDTYYLDFSYSTFYRNQDSYTDTFLNGTFSYHEMLPPYPSDNNLSDMWTGEPFYRSMPGATSLYEAPTTDVVADYSIVRRVGNDSSYSYYLAKLVDAVGYNANATSYFQLLRPSYLASSHNRDIQFLFRVNRFGDRILIEDYTTLLVEYSGVCLGYRSYIFTMNDYRTLYSPTLKLSFFGTDFNRRIVFEFPCNYGYMPFSASYPIVDGVVDTNSQSFINGYNAGYSAASSDISGDIYNEGVEDGKQIGYVDGYEEGARSSTTFFNLFSSAVNAPIKVLTDMFNFDILGVNMRDFFLGLVSLAVITTVIRWFV